jgi:hypothetical protein
MDFKYVISQLLGIQDIIIEDIRACPHLTGPISGR